MIRVAILSVLLALGAQTLAGCAARTQTMSPLDRPADFSLDIAVLAPDESSQEAGHPVHVRNSRYIVFADGRLHAAIDPQVSAGSLPQFERTLDVDELNVIWKIVHDAGLADPETTDSIGNIELISPQAGQVTYLVAVTAAGHRTHNGWTWTIHEQPAPQLTRLVRTLAWFAGEGDEPDERLLRIPLRYNFGPDPYARYRASPTVEDEE